MNKKVTAVEATPALTRDLETISEHSRLHSRFIEFSKRLCKEYEEMVSEISKMPPRDIILEAVKIATCDSIMQALTFEETSHLYDFWFNEEQLNFIEKRAVAESKHPEGDGEPAVVNYLATLYNLWLQGHESYDELMINEIGYAIEKYRYSQNGDAEQRHTTDGQQPVKRRHKH